MLEEEASPRSRNLGSLHDFLLLLHAMGAVQSQVELCPGEQQGPALALIPWDFLLRGSLEPLRCCRDLQGQGFLEPLRQGCPGPRRRGCPGHPRQGYRGPLRASCGHPRRSYHHFPRAPVALLPEAPWNCLLVLQVALLRCPREDVLPKWELPHFALQGHLPQLPPPSLQLPGSGLHQHLPLDSLYLGSGHLHLRRRPCALHFWQEPVPLRCRKAAACELVQPAGLTLEAWSLLPRPLECHHGFSMEALRHWHSPSLPSLEDLQQMLPQGMGSPQDAAGTLGASAQLPNAARAQEVRQKQWTGARLVCEVVHPALHAAMLVGSQQEQLHQLPTQL
mmetsp:Transcript_103805/g.184418  ORF Transcript_103805/g.184418 Transcript_103805/m.184418 type:complete len:335 (-) Transcript_103805:60-1064(-)